MTKFVDCFLQQVHLSTKLLKSLTKVRIILINVICESVIYLFPPVAYRACLNIKNIRDSQGKLIKTICSSDIFQSSDWNRRNCESYNMNLLRLDSAESTAVALAYSGDQYLRYYFSYTFVSGTLGNNWCRCVSNEKTGIATTFLKHQCLCSIAYFAMCEFKFPRGKKMRFNKIN